MSKDNGGPAFPKQPVYRMPDGCELITEQGGMTLRDYFAAKASDADIEEMRPFVPSITKVRNFGNGNKSVIPNAEPHYWRQIARYMHADFMLEARKQ